MLSTALASAATTAGAEARVGAHAASVEIVVGASDQITAGQQLGNDGSRLEIVVATGVAAKAVPETNKIFSNRVLQRMSDEPGPYHNFPGSFDADVFANGTKTTVPNFFNKAKPNLGNDSIQYRLPGAINGRAGTFDTQLA